MKGVRSARCQLPYNRHWVTRALYKNESIYNIVQAAAVDSWNIWATFSLLGENLIFYQLREKQNEPCSGLENITYCSKSYFSWNKKTFFMAKRMKRFKKFSFMFLISKKIYQRLIWYDILCTGELHWTKEKFLIIVPHSWHNLFENR